MVRGDIAPALILRMTLSYYSVVLSDFGVEVELTATQRTAMHRYTFRKAEPAHILVDLQSGIVSKNEQLRTHVIDAEMQLLDQYSIVGKNKVKMWVEREFFYVIKFDKPYIDIEELQPQEGEKAKRLLLSFDLKPGENVQVKVGLSTVSIEGAQESVVTDRRIRHRRTKSKLLHFHLPFMYPT